MADIMTINGNLLLNTDPSSTATQLSVSRTDASIANAERALAQISMYGSGTNNLQGAIVLSTMISGTTSGPLVERMRIHANGNVGIGTSIPAATLEVAGTMSVSQHTYLATDSGNVGIGTATPQAKLQVAGGALMPSFGNTAGAGILFPQNPGGGSGDAAWLRYYSRSGESTTLEIGVSNDADDHIALMASGNVGIGTTAPTNKLDVRGDIAVQGKHALRGTDSWLRLNQDGVFTSGVHTPGNFAPMSLNVGGASSWGNPGAGNAWITGAIGIGTTAPKRKLHVHSDAWGVGEGGAEVHASGATAGFSFTDREIGRQFDSGTAGERWLLYSTSKMARLWTPVVGDRLSVTTDGHLELQGDLRIQAGKTLYSRGRMHIHGEEILYLLNKNGVVVSRAWGGTGSLTVEGDVDYGGVLTKLDVADNFTATIRAADLLLGYSGRRGAPGRALVDYKDTAGQQTLRINYGGDWPGGCRYYVSMDRASSRTLKDNVQELASEPAHEILNQLNPVTYGLKSDTQPRNYLGFIAEDVPHEVGAPDGEAVNTDHIVAVLTRVIKDQKQEIASLHKRLLRLEAAN